MFKLVGILLLVTVACNGLFTDLLSSYVDHPELVSDKTVMDLVTFAIEAMYTEINTLENLVIERVQTQLVKGLNYKIDFTADLSKVGIDQKISCQVIIYVGIDGSKQLVHYECQDQ